MTEIRVGGVPEHFNIPWEIAQNNNLCNLDNININFIKIAGGTGEMLSSLKANKLDVIVAVTESLIAGIAKEKDIDIRLIGTYVESPLIWAVSVSPNNNGDTIKTLEDLRSKRIGISRYGSGSHTMSYVLANQYHIDPNEFIFVVKRDFEGLRQGIRDNEIDAFMWETFMTKPYYDSGVLRKLGEIKTPWPAFSFSSTIEYITKNKVLLEKLLRTIEKATSIFTSQQEEYSKVISERFGLKQEDAIQWFKTVKFSANSTFSLYNLNNTVNILISCGTLSSNVEVKTLYDSSLLNLTS